MSKRAAARAEPRMPVEQEEVEPDFADTDWDVDAPDDEEDPQAKKERLARQRANEAAELDRREHEEERASAALEAEARAEAELAERIKHLPYAYAMVKDPRDGRWYALMLEGVRADKVTRLEPNGRREHGGFALSRVVMAMQRRHAERKWGPK